jgi:putative hydrolase of the HAD superfamily
MNRSSRYRALFLDVGDTLVYAHPSPSAIMASVCCALGFATTAEQIEAAEAAAGPRIVERQAADELYSISAENSHRFWTWIYHQLLDQLDAPLALRPALVERFHETFNALDTWRLYPDTIPALQALQAQRQVGLTLAIISNWEDWLEALLAHLDIDRYFDFAVISSGVRLEKPDPAIFRTALDRAGVRPDEALHVGDSVHADVNGATSAGITPILLDRRGRHQAAAPGGVRVINTLADLPALLT